MPHSVVVKPDSAPLHSTISIRSYPYHPFGNGSLNGFIIHDLWQNLYRIVVCYYGVHLVHGALFFPFYFLVIFMNPHSHNFFYFSICLMNGKVIGITSFNFFHIYHMNKYKKLSYSQIDTVRHLYHNT